MKKTFLLLTIIATLSGCLSTTYHFNNESDYPYNATADCWSDCVCVWGKTPTNEVENAMMAVNKLVYPFWLIDFPFEIVMDTLCLPVDGIVEMCSD